MDTRRVSTHTKSYAQVANATNAAQEYQKGNGTLASSSFLVLSSKTVQKGLLTLSALLVRRLKKNGELCCMSTNGVSTATQVTTNTSRRRNIYVSSVVIRVGIALLISWLIVMAFFITTVASR